jgi:hypothetical protein
MLGTPQIRILSSAPEVEVLEIRFDVVFIPPALLTKLGEDLWNVKIDDDEPLPVKGSVPFITERLQFALGATLGEDLQGFFSPEDVQKVLSAILRGRDPKEVASTIEKLLDCTPEVALGLLATSSRQLSEDLFGMPTQGVVH